MNLPKTIVVIPYVYEGTSKHGETRTKIAAEKLPQRIKETHNDTIRIREDAVYHHSQTHIPVVCVTCGHEWEATPTSLVNVVRGCPECAKEKNNIGRTGVIGEMRHNRSTPDERELARQLYEECGNYTEVGRQLGRGRSTIMAWLDSGYRKRHNQRTKEQNQKDKESGYSKKRLKLYRQTEHGQENYQRHLRKREALKLNARDDVFLPDHPDANYQGFVSYDLLEDGYITTQEDRKFHSFEGVEEEVERRSVQQKKLSKISGETYSLDHLIPLSRGGLHHEFNFANRANELNTKKNNKLVDEDIILFCRRLFGLTK